MRRGDGDRSGAIRPRSGHPGGRRGDNDRKLPPDCRRVLLLLPALPDGEPRPNDAQFVETHLAVCASCRREAEAFLGLGELLRQQPAPAADLPNGAQAIAWILQREDESLGTEDRQRQLRPQVSRLARLSAPLLRLSAPRLALGAGLVGLALFLLAHRDHRQSIGVPLTAASKGSWEVVRLAGAPRVGSQRMTATGRLKVGQWLETDSSSKARIQVADIGQVKVEPNTRLRLVETRPNEHRLALARGALSARVSAPPRLFFVETPSAVAVDLGCAYRLTVDPTGRSLLRVTWGQVAFVLKGRESVVPEGALCETRPGIGPGTPYFEDAPAALRHALARFDFGNGGDGALAIVLARARRPDSLTLWHLLLRVGDRERCEVYDRLAALVPPPSGVTRAGVLRRDSKMLDLWRAEVEDVWWE